MARLKLHEISDFMSMTLDTISGSDIPALFTNTRIDILSIPEGCHAYDLRTSDDDDSIFSTIEEHVVVNHGGTIITLVELPTKGDPIELLDYGFIENTTFVDWALSQLRLTDFKELTVGDKVTLITETHFRIYQFMGYDPNLKSDDIKFSYAFFLEAFGRTDCRRLHLNDIERSIYIKGYESDIVLEIEIDLLKKELSKRERERVESYNKKELEHRNG